LKGGTTIALDSHQVYKNQEELQRDFEEDLRLIEASRESRRRQQELVERLRRDLPLLRKTLRRYGLIR
jgi:protein involved in sex pheromone biosynthesis